MDKLLIIDGSGLLVSNYYGTLPNEVQYAKTDEEKEANYDKIAQRNGHYINAIYPTIKQILEYTICSGAKYLAVCFDKSRSTTFRKELFEDYKSNRKKTPEPLKEQFILCEQILLNMGVPVFYHDKYEADDIAGSISKQITDPNIEKILLSKDKDYLQLVDDTSTVWMMYFSKEKAEELLKKYDITEENGFVDYIPEKVFPFTPNLVLQEKGVKSEYFYEVLGLAGDTADNIPGVKGVSEETAEKLIGHYDTISAIYDDIKTKTEKELKEFWKTLGIKRSPYNALKSQEKEATLSSTLAKIKTDINMEELIPFFSIRNLEISGFIKNEAEIHTEMNSTLRNRIHTEINNEIDKIAIKKEERER